MKRQDEQDLVRACHRLLLAAEAFVNRAPRAKRLDAERSALLEAIGEAQLVLSVHRLPQEEEEKTQHRRASDADAAAASSKAVTRLKATLEELRRRLGPVAEDLEAMQQRARKAQTAIETSLRAARPRGEKQEAA
jgi:hypothetical protein